MSKNAKIKYQETQSMYWFVALFVGITVWILCTTYFQWGSTPITSWGVAIVLSTITILPALMLYTMKIVIDEKTASVRFGIGWIKRRIPIQDLDLSTAQIVQLPWYAGIGYRISARGTFFNTRPGNAVYIKTKDTMSEFYVGTKNGDEIINIIREIQNV